MVIDEDAGGTALSHFSASVARSVYTDHHFSLLRDSSSVDCESTNDPCLCVELGGSASGCMGGILCCVTSTCLDRLIFAF